MNKSKKKNYFTKEHEEYIIQYNNSLDKEERSKLYVDHIGPVFSELVDKIVYTYKFTSLPNITYLQDECKIWLITVIDKFKPEKGSKAFSFFSVIIKNWFIFQTKENKSKRGNDDYLNISKELEQEHLSIDTFKDIENKDEIKKFLKFLFEDFEFWERDKEIRENEIKVIRAIRILLENSDYIDIFNKKAVYLYLREISGLNSKQVINNLNRLRTRYKLTKRDWRDETEI